MIHDAVRHLVERIESWSSTPKLLTVSERQMCIIQNPEKARTLPVIPTQLHCASVWHRGSKGQMSVVITKTTRHMYSMQ